VTLRRHSQSSASHALDISVDVARRAAVLTLAYIVRGDIRQVSMPEKLVPATADGLWQHTCFEAFVRSSKSAGYWEFNLSPSLQWAAYRFDAYRGGMAAEVAVTDPRIDVQSQQPELRLSAALDLTGVAALRASEDWRVGLSAIIEDKKGDKSYWALGHPAEKPDFHHPDSFVLAVSPKEESG
jgi:hypothetical protein